MCLPHLDSKFCGISVHPLDREFCGISVYPLDREFRGISVHSLACSAHSTTRVFFTISDQYMSCTDKWRNVCLRCSLLALTVSLYLSILYCPCPGMSLVQHHSCHGHVVWGRFWWGTVSWFQMHVFYLARVLLSSPQTGCVWSLFLIWSLCYGVYLLSWLVTLLPSLPIFEEMFLMMCRVVLRENSLLKTRRETKKHLPSRLLY